MSAELYEISFVRQTDDEPHLRWFQSDYFDLFLWDDEFGALCGFQLCYDRGYDEHALTWMRESTTLTHHAVDDGERSFRHGASPMLHKAQQAPPRHVAERFCAASDSIPNIARDLIQRVLAEAPACADPAPRR